MMKQDRIFFFRCYKGHTNTFKQFLVHPNTKTEGNAHNKQFLCLNTQVAGIAFGNDKLSMKIHSIDLQKNFKGCYDLQFLFASNVLWKFLANKRL